MSGPQYVLGKMKAMSADGVVHAVWKVNPVTARSKVSGRWIMTACGIELLVPDDSQQPRTEVGCMTCMARGA